MTAKEKAMEMITKFVPHAYTNVFSFRVESNFSNSKKCALVAVNEIIKELKEIPKYATCEKFIQKKQFWREVKTEIENL